MIRVRWVEQAKHWREVSDKADLCRQRIQRQLNEQLGNTQELKRLQRETAALKEESRNHQNALHVLQGERKALEAPLRASHELRAKLQQARGELKETERTYEEARRLYASKSTTLNQKRVDASVEQGRRDGRAPHSCSNTRSVAAATSVVAGSISPLAYALLCLRLELPVRVK